MKTKPSGGRHPVDTVSQEGLVETVRALVEAGAEMNYADNEGWTALYGAATNGHTEVVRTLAVAGAEVNLHLELGGTSISQMQW